MIHKKTILAIFLSLCTTLSYADSTTNMTTNAAISSTCSITGGAVNFGSVTPDTLI